MHKKLKRVMVDRQNFSHILWWAAMLPTLRTTDLDHSYYTFLSVLSLVNTTKTELEMLKISIRFMKKFSK